MLRTCFELLNQWFGAELDTTGFRMMHNIRPGLDDHYYFAARASLSWETYIQDISCHDKDWYKDILVVYHNWKWLFFNERFNNRDKDIDVLHCSRFLIKES